MEKMKLILLQMSLVWTTLFVSSNGYAQVPQQINYQAIARDITGNVIKNQNVSIRFSIHDSCSSGIIVYQETQQIQTNTFGLLNTKIGIQGNLGNVPWGIGNKFLQIEMDVSGGNDFVDMGTSQLTSVPYALFAANAPTGATGITGASGQNGIPGLSGITGATGADAVPEISYVENDSLVINFSQIPIVRASLNITEGVFLITASCDIYSPDYLAGAGVIFTDDSILFSDDICGNSFQKSSPWSFAKKVVVTSPKTYFLKWYSAEPPGRAIIKNARIVAIKTH